MLEALQAKGLDLFRRMFDIRVGEFPRVLLMQVNIFLIILSLLIIKPVVNAHFLSIVGIERLPLVFLLVAVTALVVSTVYSRLLNRMSLGKIIYRTYLTSIFGILVLAVLLRFGWFADWIIYLFYIAVALFGLLTTSQFWILANLVFNALEAKRLFGFIGAGAIAGGVMGGYVTSVFAPVMDTANLLFVVVGLLLVGVWVNRRIWTRHVPLSDSAIRARQTRTVHEHPLRLIRNSRHLTYLAIIMGISVVVAKLVEYQFSALASARYADPDQLAGFFGFWFSTFNVVSLGIQLFATQRIVGVFGVERSLFILPGALFLGGLTVLAAPVLWAGVTLKLFDISLKQSINKAATELLILPIPMAVKSQAKTFIDVFVDTTATGVGGILLIFLINGFDLPVRAVSLLMLVLIGIWFHFALKIRKEYIRSFQVQLTPGRESVRKKGFQLSEVSAVEGIRRALQRGNEKQLLFLLSCIEESQDQRLMADALPLLKHDAPLVRQGALKCLYYANDHQVREAVIPLLRDPDDDVRYRAFSCLLAHSRQDRVQVINEYLNHEDPIIAGAALVGLATEARNNPEMQRIFDLDQRIHDKIHYISMVADESQAAGYRIMVARAIGYGRLAAFYPLLRQLAEDPDLRVVENALLAAGHSRDSSFIPFLAGFLGRKETRTAARKALGQFEVPDLIPALEKILATESRREVIFQLPALVENRDTQRAIDFLLALLGHRDVALKLEALQSLRTIKDAFPHLSVHPQKVTQILMAEIGLYRDTLAFLYTTGQTSGEDEALRARQHLTVLLERRLDSTLERIFRLLGLKYPPAQIQPVYEGIRNRNPDIRMNAADYLDNILEPNLKPVLLPIVESALMDVPPGERFAHLNIQAPSEVRCLESLLRGTDDRIRLAVLRLLAAEHHPERARLAALCLDDENPRVAGVAAQMISEKEGQGRA